VNLLRTIAFKWDPVGEIKKAIIMWSPGELKQEKDYEISLYNFLHEYFADIQIAKQYGVGMSHADLNVGDKVLIEIKKDLQEKTKFDRLIGQLEDYLKWKGETIILLVGETEPNLRKKLLRHAEERSSYHSPGFHLINKQAEV
jgi:hypothetical protein